MQRLEPTLNLAGSHRTRDGRGLSRRLRPMLSDGLLTLAVIILALVVMPVAYGLLTFGPAFPRHLHGEVLDQVVYNCIANALVGLWCIPLSGRLDRKLAGVITRTMIIHGALAFGLLMSRHFHSNQVMLAAAASSVLIGGLAMYVNHLRHPIRVALLAPARAQVTIPPGVDAIRDPSSDLRGYDIILTTGFVDIPADWAAALARASLAAKEVRHLAEFTEEQQGFVSLEHFDLEHLSAHGLISYRFRKRLLDIGLVLASAPVALVVAGVAALLIRITMKGPVLFIQQRVGIGERPFNIYKLRTMAIGASADQTLATTKGDLRVTPLGRWLRRFRIDELPQLWNVLKGEMSVVGPRPEWNVLNDEITKQLPAYAYRHLVRPGITGWAQVRGGYAADLEETRVKLGYDLYYIKNFSFSLDLQILLRTIWTLITGFGAR